MFVLFKDNNPFVLNVKWFTNSRIEINLTANVAILHNLARKKINTEILITRPYIYLGIKYLQEPLCDTELRYKKYLLFH